MDVFVIQCVKEIDEGGCQKEWKFPLNVYLVACDKEINKTRGVLHRLRHNLYNPACVLPRRATSRN